MAAAITVIESQFPAHFQHHGILLKNLAVYAAQTSGFCIFDNQLHQVPAEAPALEIRSQQDRVLAGLAACVGVEPDDAEHLAAGFIDGDKGHRA
jgi:phage terminase small subunit